MATSGAGFISRKRYPKHDVYGFILAGISGRNPISNNKHAATIRLDFMLRKTFVYGRI